MKTNDAVQFSLAENGSFLLLSVIYIAATAWLSHAYSFPFQVFLYAPIFVIYGAVMFFALVGISMWALWAARPEQPTLFLWHVFRGLRVRERVILALPALAAYSVVISAFTSVKSAIGSVNPYNLDPLLAEADRVIHGGYYSWEWLQPVLGFPPVTATIDFAYSLWIFQAYTILALVAAWIEAPDLRRRYLLAFGLTWMLVGTLLAVPMASGGPWFYGLFHPELTDPFQEVRRYLTETSGYYLITTIAAQQWLRDSFVTPAVEFGAGISAMPSVHVAIAFLQVLLARHIGRRTTLLASAYFAVILIGSVHLGWHYAIDGYVSIIAVAGIWWLAGRFAQYRAGETVPA